MNTGAFILMSMAALATGPATDALAQAKATPGTPWLHVRVQESGKGKSSTVNVNLPLSVIQAAVALAPEKIVSNGHVHLGAAGKDLKVADVRKLWKELRESGEAELVSVEEEGQTVKIARRGDQIQVRLTGGPEGETVQVDVPVKLVDALLGGEGSEIDLKSAAAALQTLRGDIVRVDDKDAQVRIWIDERN